MNFNEFEVEEYFGLFARFPNILKNQLQWKFFFNPLFRRYSVSHRTIANNQTIFSIHFQDSHFFNEKFFIESFCRKHLATC